MSKGKFEEVLEKLPEKLRDRMTALTVAIVLGVLLISLGIFFMGADIHSYIGSRMVILGSGIFYLSLIALVFVID